MSDYYYFEYCFLPELLFGGKKGDIFDPDIRSLDTFDNLKVDYDILANPNEPSFDWDSLIIRKYISKKMNYFLIQFPMPKVAPDAVYGIIFEYTEKEPLFFTLELTTNGSFMLCAPHPTGHKNYGTFTEQVTIENFKNAVFKLIESDCNYRMKLIF